MTERHCAKRPYVSHSDDEQASKCALISNTFSDKNPHPESSGSESAHPQRTSGRDEQNFTVKKRSLRKCHTCGTMDEEYEIHLHSTKHIYRFNTWDCPLEHSANRLKTDEHTLASRKLIPGESTSASKLFYSENDFEVPAILAHWCGFSNSGQLWEYSDEDPVSIHCFCTVPVLSDQPTVLNVTYAEGMVAPVKDFVFSIYAESESGRVIELCQQFPDQISSPANSLEALVPVTTAWLKAEFWGVKFKEFDQCRLRINVVAVDKKDSRIPVATFLSPHIKCSLHQRPQPETRQPLMQRSLASHFFTYKEEEINLEDKMRQLQQELKSPKRPKGGTTRRSKMGPDFQEPAVKEAHQAKRGIPPISLDSTPEPQESEKAEQIYDESNWPTPEHDFIDLTQDEGNDRVTNGFDQEPLPRKSSQSQPLPKGESNVLVAYQGQQPTPDTLSKEGQKKEKGGHPSQHVSNEDQPLPPEQQAIDCCTLRFIRGEDWHTVRMVYLWFEDKFDIVGCVEEPDSNTILLQFLSEEQAQLALCLEDRKLLQKDRNCFKLRKIS